MSTFAFNSKDPGAIAEAVVHFYKEGKEEEFVNNVIEEKEKFSWGKMVKVVESFQSEINELDIGTTK
jgi:hypothetical protein